MAFDLAALLHQVSAIAGAGENLEYAPAFADFERALEGKPEQQVGTTVVPAEDPDWDAADRLAVELLGRSKDLRLAVGLACAQAAKRGFQGFADGVTLLRLLVAQEWANLYPEIDQDDPTDATARSNALAGLCAARVLSLLRSAPLVQSRSLGPVSLRHATGHTIQTVTPGALDAALREAGQPALAAIVQVIRVARAELAQIEGAFADFSGGPDLVPLTRLLTEALGVVEPRLDVVAALGQVSDATGPAQPGSFGSQPRALTFDLTSREDVLRSLDAICKYYARYEPSSPLPLLLERCKRLAAMSFVEIVKDMVPDAIKQVQLIAGKMDQ